MRQEKPRTDKSTIAAKTNANFEPSVTPLKPGQVTARDDERACAREKAYEDAERWDGMG